MTITPKHKPSLQSPAGYQLDYQAINDALIHLGEDFYKRVLGDHFKRAGNILDAKVVSMSQ